jgi:hypothetical protein
VHNLLLSRIALVKINRKSVMRDRLVENGSVYAHWFLTPTGR